MTALGVLQQCAWGATFLLLAAFVASRTLGSAPAAWRHFLWTAVLAGLLVLPAAVRVLPKWGIATAPAMAAADDAPAVETMTVRATAPQRPWNRVLAVWLGGCVLCAVRLGIGRLRISWIRYRAVEAAYARGAMDAAGGQGIPVLESALAPTALAVGLIRPAVVLPHDAGQWPAERLRAALLHELMHIRRRDLAAQAVAQAACCFYWFHPLAWLAARQVRREREQACDDAVLARGMTAHDYAGHLVESARALRGRRAGAIAMAEPSLLEIRIRALLDARRDRRPLNPTAALAMVAVLAVVLLPLAAVTVHAQSTPAPVAASVPLAISTPASEAPPQAPATGSLTGTVTDPSGARIPNARVKASNAQASNEAVTTSNTAGAFTFASMPVGQYTLQVTSPGFKPLSVKAAVAANNSSSVDARLALGDVSESVTVSAARPSGAPAAAPASAGDRIRVGGNVQACKLLYKVFPRYPEDLKAKGVTGTVHMAGIVTKEGFLESLRVLNTDVDPELASAAMEAASHWLYQPSLLNGQPVAVMTNIDITFELQ